MREIFCHYFLTFQNVFFKYKEHMHMGAELNFRNTSTIVFVWKGQLYFIETSEQRYRIRAMYNFDGEQQVEGRRFEYKSRCKRTSNTHTYNSKLLTKLNSGILLSQEQQINITLGHTSD